MNMPYDFTFVQAVVYTLGVALGYGFALLCFTALRERLDIAPVPRSLKGAPMSFIAAGLLSLGYIGLGSLFGL
jgi:electron transport complex protein RnfA